MNTQFLTTKELSLNPAGYLVANGKPVTHAEFVVAQQKAEFTVRVAEAIKGKNFKSGNVDSLTAIMEEVRRTLSSTASVSYVETPTKPVGTLTSKLAEEAEAFVNFDKAKSRVSEVNNAMQEFNAIQAIETTGDYFSEGLVKLNNIYTIAQIQTAVEAIQAIK
jgi:hypothetical protein